MKTSKIPNITLTTEAQPWPKGHVARIASLRMGTMSSTARKKIQSAIIAK